MITQKQWEDMLEDYPHLTSDQIIKSTYWMYRKLVKNNDEAEVCCKSHCVKCDNLNDNMDCEK